MQKRRPIIIGKRFGLLVVRSKAAIRFTTGGQPRHFWTCKCDCGAAVEVCTQLLNDERKSDCGHVFKEKVLNRQIPEDEMRAIRADYRRLKRIAFPEEMRKESRDWHARNVPRMKIMRRRSYVKHRDRIRRERREHFRLNPHILADYYHRRKARKMKNGWVNCTEIIKLLHLERFCHWCCVPLTSVNRSIDHVIPISRGGGHLPDNLVAACFHCNVSKNDKLVQEWVWSDWQDHANSSA